jgi:hypothetical protein
VRERPRCSIREVVRLPASCGSTRVPTRNNPREGGSGLGRLITDSSSTNGEEVWVRTGVCRKCGDGEGVASLFQIGGVSGET